MRSALNRRAFAIGSSAYAAVAALPAVAKPQFEYKFHHDATVESAIHIRSVQMWNEVERLTNGRLKVTTFPNSELGGDAAMVTMLRTGAVQFATLSDAILSAIVPVLAIMNVAFAFHTYDKVQAAMDGALGDYLRRELEAKGPVVMGTGSYIVGFRQVTTSVRPVRDAADAAGLKLRVNSNILVDLWKSLGASAIPLPLVETYSAMQTHLVDGTDYPIAAVDIFKSYEVQKYLSLLNQCFGSSYYMISNPDAWNALPADIQAIIRRVEPRYAAAQRRDIQVTEPSVLDKLKRLGMVVNTADAGSFRAKLGTSGYYARWQKTFGPAAWDLLERYSDAKLS